VIGVESFRKSAPSAQFEEVGLPAESQNHASPSVPPLREIFRSEVGFVLRVLRRLGVPEPDLDDAAQDVFVVVHRKLEGLEPRATLKGWLFGIAQRVAIARRRRARVRLEEPRADLDSAATVEGQGDATAQVDARTLLLRAIDRLDDDRRAAFVLYELEGFTIHEIARALDCPLQTVYSRLRTARQLVRSYVERASRMRAP
jgi:RNA polymerase sigma-70 factor (ECF subfamily)